MSSSSEEIWKPVVGYEGYEVSNLGRVCDARGAIIKQKMDSHGYMHVKLGDGMYQKRDNFVHRLVLFAFRGPPQLNQVTRHLNDVPDDNRLENLEWGEHYKNTADQRTNKRSNGKKIKTTVVTRIDKYGITRKSRIYEWK